MDLPQRYEARTWGRFFCKLNKSLYGFKQSLRAWFGIFSQAMCHFGYKQSNFDHMMFLEHSEDKMTALIIYVDDMIITSDDSKKVERLKDLLASEFEMKFLGSLKYSLGIKVAMWSSRILLCQRKYVLELLIKTWMLDCRPDDTSIAQNHKLFEYPNYKKRPPIRG